MTRTWSNKSVTRPEQLRKSVYKAAQYHCYAPWPTEADSQLAARHTVDGAR